MSLGPTTHKRLGEVWQAAFGIRITSCRRQDFASRIELGSRRAGHLLIGQESQIITLDLVEQEHFRSPPIMFRHAKERVGRLGNLGRNNRPSPIQSPPPLSYRSPKMSNPNRNVHFLDAWGAELAGFFQNGSICYLNDPSSYMLFHCGEPGVPTDPLTNHGLPIVMLNNKLHIQPAYYIILSSGLLVHNCW